MVLGEELKKKWFDYLSALFFLCAQTKKTASKISSKSGFVYNLIKSGNYFELRFRKLYFNGKPMMETPIGISVFGTTKLCVGHVQTTNDALPSSYHILNSEKSSYF